MNNLFDASRCHVKQIKYCDTKTWILNIHYAKRMPSISWAFGLFVNNDLAGIVTYGKPASPWLCKGIAGEENKLLVYELNRLVLKDNIKNQASFLIAKSLRLLPAGLIIVSYADTAFGHTGYPYQATNWLYTGQTKKRTDMESNGHSRHNFGDPSKRKQRSSKHRYITFTGTRRDKKRLKNLIRYKIYDFYPKRNTKAVFVKTIK
jgi:hypothetical protein